jgi:hypothetical protein
MKRILRNSMENFLQDPARNLSRNFTWVFVKKVLNMLRQFLYTYQLICSVPIMHTLNNEMIHTLTRGGRSSSSLFYWIANYHYSNG